MTFNKLVPPRISPPKWRTNAEKKSMSVLIGIICPEAIVVATDSHITESCNGTFESVDKISVVNFWPGDEVLIAQAGLWSLTNRIVDTVQKKAKGVRITEPETVTKIVEDSIRESKRPLDEEQEKYVNENPSALLLAFYVGKKPCLYTVEIKGTGIDVEAVGHYKSAGVGSYLADYFLREYAVKGSHSDFAIATSIFAIEKIKGHTKYCGGDTVIKRIAPVHLFIDANKREISKSQRIGQDFITLAEKRIKESDERTKKTRDKRVYDILKRTGRELWIKHLKTVKKEEHEQRNHRFSGN